MQFFLNYAMMMMHSNNLLIAKFGMLQWKKTVYDEDPWHTHACIVTVW
jgi:hypothetical protein